MKVSIRLLTSDDLASAEGIVCAAYNTTNAQKDQLRCYMSLQPDGWFLALAGEEPVGLVGFIDYGPFAYIGLMSVLPIAQRQGVGRALLGHLLDVLDKRGCATVLLDATEEGAALYAKFDFSVEDQVVQWQRLERPIQVEPFDPSMASGISYLQLHDLAAVTAFDAHYFGAGRAGVLAALLREYPGRAFIRRDATGVITGYLFAQGKSLGPWVAQKREDAEALLVQALTLPFGESLLVSAATLNREAQDLLVLYGFKPWRRLQHMRRGEPAHLRDRTMIYGQASFALG